MRHRKTAISALSVGVAIVFLMILLYHGNQTNENPAGKNRDAVVKNDNLLDISSEPLDIPSDELTYGPRTEEIDRFMEYVQFNVMKQDDFVMINPLDVSSDSLDIP